MEEGRRSYPFEESENKRTYPFEGEQGSRNVNHPDSFGSGIPGGADSTSVAEDAEENVVKGKGKRGGNSSFSVIKHSGNFKERPEKRRYSDNSEDKNNTDNTYNNSNNNSYRTSGKDGFGRSSYPDRYRSEGSEGSDRGSRAGRSDRGEKAEHGFGSRVHSENSYGRDGSRRDVDRDGFRRDDRKGERRDSGARRDSGRDSFRRNDRPGERRDGSRRDGGYRSDSRRDSGFARGGADSFSKKIVNEQDFSDPLNLRVIEVNEYGAFVELPAGMLTKNISGIRVAGNFTNDRDANGEKSQRVLVPFAEQIGRPGEGETIRVRFYADKSGRMTATMREPILLDGEVGILKVADATRIGIFLDNGVPKQVLLPFKEQTEKVDVGDEVLVYIYRDKSGRQAATMRVYKHLTKFSPYGEDDKVTGFIYEINKDMGIFVAVDNKYYGMIPIHEAFKEYQYGDKIEARVARAREDGKLDLLVRDKLYLSVEQDADAILYELRRNNGFLPYGDRADATFIEETYAMSKNQFKRALGHLYKNHIVELDRKKDTVRLIEN